MGTEGSRKERFVLLTGMDGKVHQGNTGDLTANERSGGEVTGSEWPNLLNGKDLKEEDGIEVSGLEMIRIDLRTG